MCTPNAVPRRVNKAKTFVSSASLRAAILTLQSEASSTTITTRRDILARVYRGLTEQGSQGSASEGEDCFSSHVLKFASLLHVQVQNRGCGQKKMPI